MTDDEFDRMLAHHGIKGQKWGIRRFQNLDGSLTPRGKKRYQNPDSTLTEEGKKRYKEDIRRNLAKKKENRIDTSTPDPKRWEEEDLQKDITTLQVSRDLTRNMENVVRNARDANRQPSQRMDLSKMSDQDLRDAINRENLEITYNQLFNKPQASKVDKGAATVEKVLKVAGDVLTTAVSAATLALTIKKLRG